MRDGLDLSRRTLRRARRWPLRLCAILAGGAAALAAAAVLWGLDLPRRLDDCLAVRYETQAAALRQEIFVLRAQLAAHADDAQENDALGPAPGALTRRGDARVLTGLPRDCAAAAGDTVVTARGEHWVGTAAAPPALDDAGLTAELILQDTAGGTDYLYFAEGDKTGQDGV